MASKTKDKKSPLVHPIISESSLLKVPDDAVEGYQKRLETGIEWTTVEEGAKHHRDKFSTIRPALSFSISLHNRIKKSILGGFFETESNLTMQERWDLIIPITIWDNENFTTDEGKICFNTNNSITDDLLNIIRQAVFSDDVEKLKKMLLDIKVLRVIDGKMTELDYGLLKFTKLSTLNLCGNNLTSIDSCYLPPGLQFLELQGNYITGLESFPNPLPEHLLYLGLSRNLLTDDGVASFDQFPRTIKVLDLSHNDIYCIMPVLNALANLPFLNSLLLIGNPCALSYAYSRTTIFCLPRLQWLDAWEILPADRVPEFELVSDDTLFTYFSFNVIRIMSAPQPPKPDKGTTATFHLELELPLLDVTRRRFLMYRNNESLVEITPPSDDQDVLLNPPAPQPVITTDTEEPPDIFTQLVAKNSREVIHYTKFETNKVQWNKIMIFQEPTVKIFCPDLKALRDTFRSKITIKLVYTLFTAKRPEKKSVVSIKAVPTEQRLVLATVKCFLKQPHWSWPHQHFHWDDTFTTSEALHWNDGDLSVLQYIQPTDKPVKMKSDANAINKQLLPQNLTCHFGCNIETLRS